LTTINFDITRLSGLGTTSAIATSGSSAVTLAGKIHSVDTSVFKLVPQQTLSGSFTLTGSITLASEYLMTNDGGDNPSGPEWATSSCTIKQNGVDIHAPIYSPDLTTYIANDTVSSDTLTNTTVLNITGLTSSANIIVQITVENAVQTMYTAGMII